MPAALAPQRRTTGRKARIAWYGVFLLFLLGNLLGGGLALRYIEQAHEDFTTLRERTLVQVMLIGEIHGQLARVNGGIAALFGPDAPPERREEGRQEAIAAAAAVHELMVRYQDLITGPGTQRDFETLMETWRQYYNTLTVRVLGSQPLPGFPLLDTGVGLGKLSAALADGLDDLAQREHDEVLESAASQDDRYTETFLWVGGAFLVSLALLALATAAAIRSDADRRRGERRFRTLVQESADVISVVDGTGMHQYVSPSTLAVMGYRPEELAGRPYQELLNPDDVERAMRIHRAIIQNPAQEVRFETRLRHADNTWHWHEIVARNMLADPTIRGIVFNHRDVTERRRFADQLAHEASHDALTGLANRAVFLQDLAQALLSADGLTWHTGVLFLDLNDFKGINDSWGHETGDAVLVTTAQVLQASVRGSDTVARVGGDEFGIVLAKIDEPRNAEDVAQRIISGLIKPIDAAGHTLQVSLSIGIAIQDQDTHDPDELLRQADLAMYKAKRCKGNSYQMFRADLDTAHTAGTPTVRELETAIAQQQLYLEYQPIVAIASGELLGAEALVRWRHPTLGTLGPLAFIPLAEDSGLIKPLGAWVLRSACAQVRRWQQGWSGDRGLALSVNLSPQQLEVPDLVDQVLRILDETGFAPHDLALEITENALVKEDIAIRVLAQLHDHGIRLALDDFGTGYSSLRYLTNLPVDILKLDRCFVTELDGTPEGSAVAEAVIRLSHVLRIDAIAEGIEDVGQANELAQLGYAVAQGYHFAKPLGPEAFEAILNQAVPRLPVVLDGPGVTCSAGGGPPRSSA